MPNTINSKTDLNFAGKWLSSVFQNKPLLTKKRRRLNNIKQIQKLKKELNKTTQDLNSILNKWKWQGKSPKTAQEFITNFGKWVENKGWDEMEKENYEYQKENQKLIQELEKRRRLEAHFNSQIKDLYLLFDSSVKNWEVVDYMKVYDLLKEVAEREKERERLKGILGNK